MCYSIFGNYIVTILFVCRSFGLFYSMAAQFPVYQLKCMNRIQFNSVNMSHILCNHVIVNNNMLMLLFPFGRRMPHIVLPLYLLNDRRYTIDIETETINTETYYFIQFHLAREHCIHFHRGRHTTARPTDMNKVV